MAPVFAQATTRQELRTPAAASNRDNLSAAATDSDNCGTTGTTSLGTAASTDPDKSDSETKSAKANHINHKSSIKETGK